MLIQFFEALTETVLMVILSLVISAAISLPCAYVLIYTHLVESPFSRKISKLISTSLNFIKLTPFLLLILFVTPYLKTLQTSVPNYFSAIIPLAIISTILITHELYLIATTQSQKILELGRKLSAKPQQIILLMLIPNNVTQISIALGKIMALLVGYSTIAGALGLGGIGQLVTLEHLNSNNITLLSACIFSLIAFNKLIDYTFSSFTKLTNKR
jgi:D-methionine transport system permease protein